MDTKKTPLAVALFIEVLYLFCAISVFVAPDFIRSVYGGWFHGISLESVWTPERVTIGGILLGMVTSFVFAYIATLVFVLIYHAVSKKEN